MSMGNVRKKEDTGYITLLSVISAVAVVIIHVNSDCFGNLGSDNRYWFGANIIECIVYFAVPIFFMISGATLIDYRERYSTKEYFIKRIKKTVIPFIVWSIVGLLYNIFVSKDNINLGYIIGIFFCPTGVYWFFAPLFTIYLIIPILACIPKEKRNKIFFYGAFLSFFANGLVPFIQNNLYFFPFKMVFSVGNDYTFYVLAGYILRNLRLSRKKEILV